MLESLEGRRIIHKKIGEGVIVSCEKRGEDNYICIRFDSMNDKEPLRRFKYPDSFKTHIQLLDSINPSGTNPKEASKGDKAVLFFDTEVTVEGKRLYDIGAVGSDGKTLHSTSRKKFASMAHGYSYLCGHNIVAHDLKYVIEDLKSNGVDADYIDTLYLSPLFFPTASHHNLLKDDKLQSEDINNPLSDARKAKDLFFEEIARFALWDENIRVIFSTLLNNISGFNGFFKFVDSKPVSGITEIIKDAFAEELCDNVDLESLVNDYPVELAYSLALINSDEDPSIIPPWVARNHPKTHTVLNKLRNTPCHDEHCRYCSARFDIKTKLKYYFGYDDFRLYNGEPLQERAIRAAMEGDSLLAIFPTGGGKSLTFQLPALIEGDAAHGLTVVISPLQSLMKDQVDGLFEKGISFASTINSSLNPIERRDAYELVENGVASILYIAPESLRSRTVKRLLSARNIVRFVIDEAHCFSAWGQDFRVDYQYIGKFIKKLQEQQQLDKPIPVSCFTATAKPKVISDIKEYFRQTCGIELSLFATNSARENLRYEVLYRDNDEEKFKTLRDLINSKKCPTIVYVARTKRTEKLAEMLCESGINAVPYHGKMKSYEKKRYQDSFMSGEVDVIVATTAFGMGIDKEDVGMVIHYNISTSLEDYVQEAGRAGRNPEMNAECFVLFNDDDLDKHFQYLIQTKLSQKDIQQVWKGIKTLCKKGTRFCKTPLEIAKASGWDDNQEGVETKVRAAIAALEQAGYVRRGDNVPRVYANGIRAYNFMEAANQLDHISYETEENKQLDKRVLQFLISRRSHSRAGTDDAESRVDYIAERLGVTTGRVIRSVSRLRDYGVLNDGMDMSAIIHKEDKQTKAETALKEAAEVERYLIENLPDSIVCTIKELNTEMRDRGLNTNIRTIQSVLIYWVMNKYVERSVIDENKRMTIAKTTRFPTMEYVAHRNEIAKFIINYLYDRANKEKDSSEVPFSVLGIKEAYNSQLNLLSESEPATMEDVMHALSFLHRIDSMNLEGGFLVFYNTIQVERIEMDNKRQYRKDDYAQFEEYYVQRMVMIHIVGEFAHLMTKDYEEALEFVQDYFSMDYMLFIKKYFKGDRAKDIRRTITPEKYNKLFESLSIVQRDVIDDDESQYIVVAAGPGSGKTKLLVHKLAALLTLEDTRVEQLLMLTFSRSAATEFKQRLIQLIGDTAYYVDIKTFHSYCFDLIGEIGNLTESANIVPKTLEMIRKGEIDTGRLTRTVLVIDEAQDMDADEFALVEELMNQNEGMKVIAVGDDDQNIYEFRKSDSKYMRSLVDDYGAKQYELLENYRSDRSIVELANSFASSIQQRMKTKPIIPVKEDEGLVMLRKFTTKHMEVPTLELIEDTYEGGTCCVMTNTNAEALLMTGILNRSGYKARLIQSSENYNLYNLYEIRRFIDFLSKDEKPVLIVDEVWENAVEKFSKEFNHSTCFDECMRLIKKFRETNKKKYFSDFIEYVRESKLEDFAPEQPDKILVSTIHKSKGREFDNVYIMLNDYYTNTDTQRHVVYVGITRAKSELYVNYNTDVFDRYTGQNIHFMTDSSEYEEADEAMLQLSHDGVNLGYFKYIYDALRYLRSGDELYYSNDGLYADKACNRCVLKLSKKSMSRVNELRNKGFEVYRSEVRNMVYWKGLNEDKESLIILPNIYFRQKTMT